MARTFAEAKLDIRSVLQTYENVFLVPFDVLYRSVKDNLERVDKMPPESRRLSEQVISQDMHLAAIDFKDKVREAVEKAVYIASTDERGR